jgi:hypothetical protein
VFDAPARILFDLKLDGEDRPRPESALLDFDLCAEVLRLMERLEEVATGTIESIEIRAGLPRRIVFRVAADGIVAMDAGSARSEARQ